MAKQQVSVEQRIKKARINMLLDHPFFGTLSTQLLNVIDKSIPTACTNGTSVRWSPDFVQTLSDRELVFVYAHEIMHAAAGHIFRRGHRNPRAWNIAADKVVNPILKDSGMTPPADLLWPSPSEAGKSAEAIYREPTGKGDGPGRGGIGEFEDAPVEGSGAGEKPLTESDWKVLVTQSALAAKSQGKLPGGLRGLIDEILYPPVDWKTVLQDFVDRSAKNDYTWSHPNRRYIGSGIVLPTLRSDTLPPIVTVIDTSSSVDDRELAVYAGALDRLLDTWDTTLHVAYAHTQVYRHDEFSRDNQPVKLRGIQGGGTSFVDAFDWVKRQQLEPACLIYLTDLQGDFPLVGPDYPVLWLATTDLKAPFGQTIRMSIEDAAKL